LDLLAPGGDILGLDLGSGVVTRHGTSLAAPLVTAAAVAVQARAAELGISVSPAQTEWLLQESGAVVVDGDNELTSTNSTGGSYRRLDVKAALEMLEELAGGAGLPTVDALTSDSGGDANSASALLSGDRITKLADRSAESEVEFVDATLAGLLEALPSADSNQIASADAIVVPDVRSVPKADSVDDLLGDEVELDLILFKEKFKVK
jgi:hypothetical protein